MASELQFIAIAAFLMWCLISSLCGFLDPDEEPAQLVWREHGHDGWSRWRAAHFGLTAADHRVLGAGGRHVGQPACAGLLHTVMHQTRHPESDAVQFAIVGSPDEQGRVSATFISDVHDLPHAAMRRTSDRAVVAASPSVEWGATACRSCT